MSAPEMLACGHESTPRAMAAGYATVRATGERICYACADDRQRADVAGSDEFGAYVSGDARTVTTWTGGELARVTSHGAARNGWHGSQIHYWTARTPDGRTWHGRNGGPGMCVTFRAHKRQPADA